VNTGIFLHYQDVTFGPPKDMRGTIVFMDQLSVHKTPVVLAKFASFGMTVALFPAKTATELSALDNFFFSLFKTNLGVLRH